MRKLDVYTYRDSTGQVWCPNVFLYWGESDDLDEKWFPYRHQDTEHISGSTGVWSRHTEGGHWETVVARL